jgi:hypothetical protein
MIFRTDPKYDNIFKAVDLELKLQDVLAGSQNDALISESAGDDTRK